MEIAVDFRAVGSSNKSKCSQVESDGDWWTTSQKKNVFLVLDVGTSRQIVKKIFVLSTNVDARPKSLRVDEFVPNPTGDRLTDIQLDNLLFPIAGELIGTWDVGSRVWPISGNETTIDLPAGCPKTRFLRLWFEENSGGGFTAINDIRLKGTYHKEADNEFIAIAKIERLAWSFGFDFLPKPGVPGVNILFGRSTFPFVYKDDQCPIAAAFYGAGRVVSHAHNGYLLMPDESQATAELTNFWRSASALRSSILWAGNALGRKFEVVFPFLENSQNVPMPPAPPVAPPCLIRVGCLGYDDSVVGRLAATLVGDIEIVAVESKVDDKAIARMLAKGPKVILWVASNQAQMEKADRSGGTSIDQRAVRLLKFVAGGGGVLTGVCPWGWEQVSRGGRILESLWNDFLVPTGIVLTGNYFESPKLTSMHPEKCWDSNVGESLRAGAECCRKSSTLPEEEARRCLCALDAIPFDSCFYSTAPRPTIELGLPDELVAAHAKVLELLGCVDSAGEFPKPAPNFCFPLTGGTTAARLRDIAWVVGFSKIWERQAKCPKAPGLGVVPGDVGTSKRIRAMIKLNKFSGWQGTGTYLPAGEVLTCKIEGGKKDLWMVRIGCHTDRLRFPVDRNSKLSRWNDISICRPWDMTNKEFQISSPFGGLIYFERSNGTSSDEISVELSGVVRSPHFVHPDSEYIPQGAATTKSDWDSMTWDSPFGEIEGRRIILSLPVSTLKMMKSPKRVLDFWDEVLETEMSLNAEKLERKERIVCDVQISAGYMHSGYPIMCHLDVAESQKGKLPFLIDVDELMTSGAWGVFHELGHNRQRGEWTFSGTGEVTVNIFTLYAYHKVVGQSPRQTQFIKDALKGAAVYIRDASQTFENKWQCDPGVALITYVLLLERFGWDVYRETFKRYRQMSPTELPQTDAAKIIMWARETSKVSGRDLRSYYKNWKWPHMDVEELNCLGKLPKIDIDCLLECK